MATYNNARLVDEKVICPYNNAHVLTKITISKHLSKCEKNYPHIVLSKCPFNHTHRIETSKFHGHLMECPDRDVIDSHVIVNQDENIIKGNLAVPSYENKSHVTDSNENWEDEIPSQPYTFNRMQNINKNVQFFDVTKHTLKSKKERLQIYQKLHRYKDGENLPSNINDLLNDKPKPAEEPKVNQQFEMRRPKNLSMAETIASNYGGLGRANKCAANFGVYNGPPKNADVKSTSVNTSANGVLKMETETKIIGRGRSLIKHKEVKVPPGFENKFPLENNNCREFSTSDGSDSAETELSIEKQVRKLGKKLKQIEILQKKKDSGENLSLEELKKVSSADVLKSELENLKK